MLYDNASNVPNGKVIIEIKLKSGYLFKSLSIVKRIKFFFNNTSTYILIITCGITTKKIPFGLESVGFYLTGKQMQ